MKTDGRHIVVYEVSQVVIISQLVGQKPSKGIGRRQFQRLIPVTTDG